MKNKIQELGIRLPEVLLPKKETDLTKWAVVACDQYTSQPEYWRNVQNLVGASPSTLHMIFPEVYLEDSDKEERMKKINETMKTYIKDGILSPQKQCFVYVDRKTSHTASRKGLVMAVDLEKYDYSKGSNALIRATEGTVIDRLPPRIRIRENASIELPHIMLLVDDPEKTVIEPLAGMTNSLEKLYDFELMMDGGHVTGYKIEDEQTISGIAEAIGKLADPEVFSRKYGVGSDKSVLLFAVGDGNHSLASAKAYWESLKPSLPDSLLNDHPARFALVEVVNVHDDGLVFEPIHRVVFNINTDHLLESMIEYYKNAGSNARYELLNPSEPFSRAADKFKADPGCHVIPFSSKDKNGVIIVDNPKYNLEVGTLQSFLDDYAGNDSSIKIDYIHGDDVIEELCAKQGNMGFYLSAMDKHDLFKTVILDGVLPRKTFSMGEAEEKRFYLECRKIV